jgi:hypothetical protein
MGDSGLRFQQDNRAGSRIQEQFPLGSVHITMLLDGFDDQSIISAKGLSTRSLRRRSSLTALALVASQARWKPPRPLIAKILPFS